jgi:tetratricopeptide (TPR) repeat protein
LGGTHYAAAAAAYREATPILTALAVGAVDLLRQTLDEGDAFLASDDARGAVESFELALAIDPQDLRAQRGAGRAAVLDRLLDLLANGAEAEHEGDLERAEQHYREAVELDPWSSRAEEALGRSQTLMRETRFTESMSGALDALEREDYAVARAAFEQAGALHPGSSQVAEGLARLDEAEKVDAIARHARRAEDYEGKEDWQPAFEEFEKVLGLDETIVFAQQGAARTARRVDLARAIDSLLAHPARLSDDDVLAEAELLLIDATEVAPAGPAHRARVERLRRLVRSASTYVRVRLRSDSLTEVVVYRVGRLGTFDDRELELRPGRYTVVGSRRGYRDVRRELVVTAGAEPEPLVVRCEEPI